MVAVSAFSLSWTKHTRQCLAIHPARSIRAVDVITVAEPGIARYGVPEHLRSDNGPEFSLIAGMPSIVISAWILRSSVCEDCVS
jgi:hypothetical protein